MAQGFGQSHNRRGATQCPELPDPCGNQEPYTSPLTSRRQTHGGAHNCPHGTGRESYNSPPDTNVQTYNCPPPHTTQDTYSYAQPDTRPETHKCPHESRRETYAISATPVRGRDTYAMPARRGTVYAPPAGGKRGTYDVPQEARRGTYGLPHTPRQGTYTQPGSGSPEIAPQYLATICPDADLDEERRRLKEDFRSMQTTPWTMEQSVTTPPWGEGPPPRGGLTPGDTMGGCLENYPMRETAPWDRDCEVFSSPDTAVSLSPLSTRALPPSPRSASPQTDGGWSSTPSPTRSPTPSPSHAPDHHHHTPCSPPEQHHHTPCSPPKQHHQTPCSPPEQHHQTPCFPPEHLPQHQAKYLANVCPDADLEEERRRLKADFRSMQTTPWTMEQSVTTPPWGEGPAPRGGVTAGDTMGGFLGNYPMRETAPWDRGCEEFSSPDTTVSSPLSKRAQPRSPRSASPQSDGGWSSTPSPTRSPSPNPSPAPDQRHHTPCSPPEHLSRRGADGTNLVKPTLDDMVCAIKFGTDHFVVDRMQHLKDINLMIDKAVDAVRTAQSRMGDFEQVMDNGTTMITPFVHYWGDVAEHYGKQRDRCLDPNQPAPNLNINHPSRQVNQKAYCDLLWQMALAAQAAERGVRAQDLEYGELDEHVNQITEWLRLSLKGLVCHIDKNKRVNDQFLKILATFNERRRRVLAFLEEWQCGGDELNEPPLSPADRPRPPAIPEIPPHDASFAPPAASTPCGSPSGGRGGQNVTETEPREHERADRMSERAQMLQQMVSRFNDMESHAMHEVLNIHNQNSLLEQSLNAMGNVPPAP